MNSNIFFALLFVICLPLSGCALWKDKVDTVIGTIEDTTANGINKGKEIKDSLIQEGQEIQEGIQDKIAQFDTALAEVRQARESIQDLFATKDEGSPDVFSCALDTDCLLVPYTGCCSDVLAIRADAKQEYLNHSDWQTDARNCAAVSCEASFVQAEKKPICISQSGMQKTCVAVPVNAQ